MADRLTTVLVLPTDRLGLVGGQKVLEFLRRHVDRVVETFGENGLTSGSESTCVQRDVPGGSWADPKARWADLQQRIAAWRPDDNQFPGLASHAKRVVGWATLALATDDPGRVREYAGHAALHVGVVRDALECEVPG